MPPPSGGSVAYQQPVAATLQSACVPGSEVQVSGQDGAVHGVLCAFQPSALDPLELDAGSTNAGYGFHAVYFPSVGTLKGIFVHFPGSGGRPFDPLTGSFQNTAFFEENQSRGYLIIQLANENDVTANSYCDTDSGNQDVDNCMGIVRHQLLTGSDPDAGRIPGLSVDVPNSIESRLSRLLQKLVAMGVLTSASDVLDGAGNVRWEALNIGGSSQGAGDAYYIAKNVASVVHACLLSGPYDAPDAVNPGADRISDWQLQPGRLTADERIVGLIGDGDQVYVGPGLEFSTGTTTLSVGARNLEFAYGVMGLGARAQVLSRPGQLMSVSHRDVTGDPAFAAQRSAACMP